MRWIKTTGRYNKLDTQGFRFKVQGLCRLCHSIFAEKNEDSEKFAIFANKTEAVKDKDY